MIIIITGNYLQILEHSSAANGTSIILFENDRLTRGQYRSTEQWEKELASTRC